MRFAGAAFDLGFSPFGPFGVSGSYGWQAVLLAGLVSVCVALLILAAGPGRDELWLAGERGGVVIPSDAIEGMLRDEALTHDDVVRAVVAVRVRRGSPVATLELDLRPLADGDAIAAALGATARASLAGVTGIADPKVRVRTRVLTVRQLPGRLP
jgi:hypothetical protein